MDSESRVAKPFRSLDELYNSLDNLKPWPKIIKLRESAEYVYTTNDMRDNGRIVQLPKLDRDQQPRTIICHDLKGGYLQDKFIDGSPAYDSYLFYHWSIVDIFIYFSHHLVTIPPYGWINAAHNHGVKVLGTIITEHTDGEHIWERILSTIDETKRFADALIMLAKFYNFEGWLLNVENKIKPDNIERLLYFVQYLTVEIHNEIPSSEIIWYDSVTVDGNLKWQNELNDENKSFFENCDGIFLNYNWTDLTLENSKKLASRTERIRNVFVGLDVWGRGCPGGGGFNSIEALQKIRKHDLSVAIFAPAWTHEYFNGESFQQIENIFWAQLSSLLYIHVPIYDNEHFTTSFCRGSGQYYYQNGIRNVEKDTSFYNLSWQQTQMSVPATHLVFTYQAQKDKIVSKHGDKIEKNNGNIYETAFHIIVVQDKKINLQKKYDEDDKVHHVDYNDEFSYDGGGCLELSTTINNLFQSYHRLLLIHLEFDLEIQIIITHKKKCEDDETCIRDNNINDGASISPILIVINNNIRKHLVPYKNISLISKWRQSHYHAKNIKTINEIGVIFSPKGRYYIGKIQVQPMSYPQ
ncbi:hypothetical protein PV327_002062 [Microctonus hyperodae]|uniref:Cytosolic endo-beta-N-acetylglucosaminidase n=1 Tax=Microctonus hyperodae TaxID=165561 RepID=A0AA39FEY6_MICHY|nr:hypothetical protein PV327_002062 [Microctonus hyperodae]